VNPRFMAIAGDPRIIPGVHHYCDEWCDYCPVTERCLAFRCTAEWRRVRKRSSHEPTFASAAEAITFTREISEVEGTSTEELDTMMKAPPGRSEIRTADPLAETAWRYAIAAALFLNMHPPAPAARAAAAPSPVEIVLWYHVRIYMRVFRALVARERTAAGRADRTEEALGCAKLALICAERSRAALPALVRPDTAHQVHQLERCLDGIVLGIEERFPDARAFVRVGLDVPAAA
jgi:hypothetical protein